jgi:hypothetical protein
MKLFYYFSDWIIIWYLLYQLKIINYNPKIAIILGIIENIIFLFIYSNKKKSKNNIKLNLHFTIKLLMFYLLRDTIYNINDFNFAIILYISYNIFLKVKYKISILEYYFPKHITQLPFSK